MKDPRDLGREEAALSWPDEERLSTAEKEKRAAAKERVRARLEKEGKL